MNSNKVLTRELLDLKVKVMIQKIDKLYLICNMLFTNSEAREVKSLEVIKEQYFQMYNKLIETRQYEKYREVEDIIIKEIAKIELNIDQYIYNTVQSYEEIIKSNIDIIYQSKNYQSFSNLEQERQHIETLKQVLKLYSPYISKNEIERLYNDISMLKFNVLWRSQVEHLIYGSIQKSSTLMQYDSQEERKYFIEQLEEKMKSLTILEVESIENDEILRVNPATILKDNNLLERLIIIDMKKNPYNYINLVKAKVFNAHLCNIANNPFEQEVYLTEEELHRLGYWKYGMFKFRKEEKVTLKANKVNYSLLRAILKGVITDENISIIECENLYKKFGFKCRPIITNDGQKCVEIIYNRVKGTKEYEKTIKESKKGKEGRYCKIDFEGLVYDFNDDLIGQIIDNVHEYENNIRDLLYQRKVKTNSKIKKRKFYDKKQEIPNEEENQQNRKEKVKEEGIITKDIDIIVLLLQDIITNNRSRIGELKEKLEEKSKKEEEFWTWSDKYEIERYEEKIKSEENRIKELEHLKNKNGQFTLEETKKLLLIINSVYRELNIRYNVWNLLPLEDMSSDNSNKVYLVPIPEESGTEHVEVSHSFLCGSKYEDRYYHKSDLQPLWKKYQGEFKDLDIDVKKYSRYHGSTPQFEICVSLDDISELPIDYEKVKILTKEELQEIIEREEGNER